MKMTSSTLKIGVPLQRELNSLCKMLLGTIYVWPPVPEIFCFIAINTCYHLGLVSQLVGLRNVILKP